MIKRSVLQDMKVHMHLKTEHQNTGGKNYSQWNQRPSVHCRQINSVDLHDLPSNKLDLTDIYKLLHATAGKSYFSQAVINIYQDRPQICPDMSLDIS